MDHRRIATEADVRGLSFYSLCRIQELTGYADPIGAVIAGRAFDVAIDALGNVTAARAVLAPTSRPDLEHDPDTCTCNNGPAMCIDCRHAYVAEAQRVEQSTDLAREQGDHCGDYFAEDF